MDGLMDVLRSFSLSCWLLCCVLPSAYIEIASQPAGLLGSLAGFQHILAEISAQQSGVASAASAVACWGAQTTKRRMKSLKW